VGMISTQGWDTAFALRLPAINKAIKAAAKKGELRIPPIDLKSEGLEMTGEFGVWQLTSEGLRNTGGTAVNMLFPVSRATLSWDGQRYEVVSATAIGTVQLGLLADGTKHKLVVDHRKGVRITEFRGGDAEAAEYFKMALETFLRANMDIFKHSFAAVDFNQKAAKEISWLTPKAAGYWYSGGKDDNESCLAVLCMTENYVAGNPTPAPTLSSGLIPVGATCALLLSRQLFVRNLLLPAITDSLGLRCDPATEKKLKPAPHELRKARIDRWFELQEHDARIVKKPKTGSIPVGKRRVDVSWLYGVIATGGGIGLGNPWVLIHCLGLAAATFLINLVTQRGKPAIMGELALRIDKLEIVSREGEVSFKVALHGTLTVPTLFRQRISLATVDVEVTTTHTPELSQDGKFRFRQKGKPVQSSPVVKLAEWIKTGAEVEKYVLMGITVVMELFTDGLATLLFTVEAALCQAGLNLLEKGVVLSTEEAAKTRMPVTFASFVDTAVNPMQWNGNAGMIPRSVAMGEAVLISGDPVAV
jgi:Clostridium P-47 protein